MKKTIALLLALVMVFALAACSSSDDAEETTEVEETVEETAEVEEAEAPTDEEVAEAEGDAADAGDASGEASGEVGAEASAEGSGEMAPSTGEFEITVDGVTGTATYEDVEDGGDEATKTFLITFNGEEITGSINMGVWTADDADYQAVVDAVQEAFEAENGTGGSGEASGEVETEGAELG